MFTHCIYVYTDLPSDFYWHGTAPDCAGDCGDDYQRGTSDCGDSTCCTTGEKVLCKLQTPAPTYDPTVAPTVDPTAHPTADPTSNPTTGHYIIFTIYVVEYVL